MDYFKHNYNGIEYELKPCRKAQVEISKIRKQKSDNVPDEVKNNIPKLSRRMGEIQKKIDEYKKEYDNATDERKAEIDKECEPLSDELSKIMIELEPLYSGIYGLETTEEIMFILLDTAKNPDGSKKYGDMNRELFENICDSIYNTYGAEQYKEICEAIAEDCFTMTDGEETNRPRADFLKNRKHR